MKLLADENLPDELVDVLRDKGYNISSVIPGTDDPDIARLAKKERRILLTQDKDFSNILWYPPKNFCGIIRIKFHPPIIQDILSALEDLFQRFSQKDLNGKLIILERDGFRIR